MSDAPGAIDVVPFDDRWTEAHQRFAARTWPTKGRRGDARYVRWKFRGPERGAVDGLLLAVAGGEVLGQLGLLPVTVASDGATHPAQWACDLMVDPSERRRGIASRLFAVALGRGVLTLGSDASAGADAVMGRLGFASLAGPRVAVLPLDPRHVLGWKLEGRARRLVPLLAALARPLLHRRSRRLRRHAGPPPAPAPWPEVVERVAAVEERWSEPHVVHDRHFLAWRCAGLPGFVAELTPLVGEGGAFAVPEAAPPYCYLHDWWAPDEAAALALLREVRRLALAAGAATVKAAAQEAQQLAWLRRAGFLAMRRPVAILWHPVERLPKERPFRYRLYDADGNL